jgi:hypothetical protein
MERVWLCIYNIIMSAESEKKRGVTLRKQKTGGEVLTGNGAIRPEREGAPSERRGALPKKESRTTFSSNHETHERLEKRSRLFHRP